ncbi:MAG: hypothetical protein QF441_10330 [Bacteriovoracaceae bacterium]|jgi:hypothetical protein|nr:hypothetical protein [Bacteriovoracaceae bacterium]|tara:strand:+ start:265 stop:552 length:288 start_codon:yes stop_codon:yes gene_type:complete
MKNDKSDRSLKDELLKTLSFFEPMGLDMIFLDLDKDFLMLNKDLTYEDLLKELSQLEKEKYITTIKEKDHKKWIKVYPKKTVFQKIKFYLKSLRK